VTSFQGRGFLAGGIPLDDLIAVTAAGVAIVGLLVEIGFVASFTQLLFGAK
jgi:hypothetical protein